MEDPADANAAVWQSAESVQAWSAEAGRQERGRRDHRRFMAVLLPFAEQDDFTFLDLGAGTGAASRTILDLHPRSTAILADFSAGEWPAAIPAALDAGGSSMCVHHLTDERKQGLFAEILAHLVPGGWYLNYDPVRGADPVVEATWQRVSDHDDPAAAERRRHRSPLDQARWDNHVRYLIPLDQQLGYLRSAGFEGVDVYWKQLENVIYGGRRPR